MRIALTLYVTDSPPNIQTDHDEDGVFVMISPQCTRLWGLNDINSVKSRQNHMFNFITHPEEKNFNCGQQAAVGRQIRHQGPLTYAVRIGFTLWY